MVSLCEIPCKSGSVQMRHCQSLGRGQKSTVLEHPCLSTVSIQHVVKLGHALATRNANDVLGEDGLSN
jgi:hypothetical protein